MPIIGSIIRSRFVNYRPRNGHIIYPFLFTFLKVKFFNGLIDIAVGQKQDIEPKPSPDSVNEVISILGLKPSECIYVGDSEVDIQTAKNAGIDCISVTWGYKNIDFLYENGASVFAYIPEDICNLI